VDIKDYDRPAGCEGFVKDSSKWVIFPRLSYINHGLIEERNVKIGKELSSYRFNSIEGISEKAVVTSGISYAYVKEALKYLKEVKLIKIATAYPFPEDFVLEALRGVKEAICIEELSPYLEEQVLKTVGKHHLDTDVFGKINGEVAHNGENSVELSKRVLSNFLKAETSFSTFFKKRTFFSFR
jgi:indolepyruvate ferredoxin oxidoreductase alpha subunit